LYLSRDSFEFTYTVAFPTPCGVSAFTGSPCCNEFENIYTTDIQVITKNTIRSSRFYSPSSNASGKYVGYGVVEESNSILGTNNSIIANANGKIVDSFTNYLVF